MDPDTDVPTWECSKENVQPIRQGRNVDAIAKALGRGRKVDGASSKFEERLGRTVLGDRLSLWCEYLRWARTVSVTDTHSACLPLLRRCAEEGEHSRPRWKEDLRYTAVWLALAELQSDPLPIFERAHAASVGRKHAVFYCAWGAALERAARHSDGHLAADAAERLRRAERVYAVGVAADAQPRSQLEASLARVKASLPRATREKTLASDASS